MLNLSQHNLSFELYNRSKMRQGLRRSGLLNKRFTLIETERRFRTACSQIIHLNLKVKDMQGRYDRAKQENRRSFRYHLRLRLAVLEGVRNMYNDYAHEKANEIMKLRRDISQQSPFQSTEEEDMSDTD